MNKVILAFVLIFFTQCSALRKAGLVPSELEMAAGLKGALEQGLLKSFDQFANPQQNQLLKLAMPGEVEKLQTVLSTLGVKTDLTGISNKLTYAMTQSMAVAKPVFVQSLRKMSIRDAAKILITDNPHAATDYFKATATTELTNQLTPIIDSTVKLGSLDQEYRQVATLYNAIPFLNKKIEPSINSFIAGRAIDIMFKVVEKEEQEIRSKYSLRKTDLIRKVFTYAEKEIQKKFAPVPVNLNN